MTLKNLLSTLTLAAAVLSVVPSGLTQDHRTRAALSRIEEQGQKLLEGLVARGVPGASAALLLPDGRQVQVTAGIASFFSKETMTSEHRMLVGSTGKTFVSAVALALCAEGKLALDRTVKSYYDDPLPEWISRVPNASAVTLRQLLQHSSGIPRYVMKPAFAAALKEDLERTFRPEELLSFVHGDRPLFAPGGGFSYADTNYIIVGILIEKVTGEPFYGLARKRLLVPHGLSATVPSDRIEIPRMAGGRVVLTQFLGVPDTTLREDGSFTFNPQFEWCGGGFASTPTDLARWAGILYTGRAFEKPYLPDLLSARDAPELGPSVGYGLGVMLRDTGAGRLLGHEGVMPGYLTSLGHFPDCQISAAIQVNTDAAARIGRPLTAVLVELVRIAQQEFER
ncbi:MAG: serine hydrolase domain-containing protein [Planctomycetota bacterium]